MFGPSEIWHAEAQSRGEEEDRTQRRKESRACVGQECFFVVEMGLARFARLFNALSKATHPGRHPARLSLRLCVRLFFLLCGSAALREISFLKETPMHKL